MIRLLILVAMSFTVLALILPGVRLVCAASPI